MRTDAREDAQGGTQGDAPEPNATTDQAPTAGLAAIRHLVLPADLLEHGHATLRTIGTRHVEGMILWAGRCHGTVATVEAVLTPAQRAIRTADGGLAVVIDGAELHRLNIWLYQHRLQLLAQVHSHPGDAYHSELDDTIPVVTTTGALSLVVPDFARGPADLGTYAVYRLMPSGSWHELTTDDVRSLVAVSADDGHRLEDREQS